MPPTVPTADRARRRFAEDLRRAAPVTRNEAVVTAFATVPRERFLGRGPWRIHPRIPCAPPRRTRSAEPHEVYRDVLVTIDAARGLNNGQPSLWALVFDHLDIRPGDTILQIGAGTGYFTAILAHLVGPKGKVLAYEIDAALAETAASNLEGDAHVEVICGDAVRARNLPRLDRIAAFAGVTHPPRAWVERLAEGGRMMLPMTATDHRGFLMLVERADGRDRVSSLGGCGFYPCHRARTDTEAAALRRALDEDGRALGRLDELIMGVPGVDAPNIWLAGRDFAISKRPEA